MRCEQALEHLSDYIDGAVTAPMRVALDNHFAECRSCQRELVTLRECLALFQELTPVEPPRDFRARVWARIEADQQARRRSWREILRVPALPARAFVAAAVLLVVVASSLLTTQFWTGLVALGPNPSFSPGIRLRPAADLFHGRPDLMVSSETPSPIPVGEEASLTLDIQPKQPLRNARLVMVRPDGLLSSTRGVSLPYGGRIIWQGSLDAGSLVSVPLKLTARSPGVYRVLIRLEADDYGGYGCRIFVPFGVEPARSRQSVIAGELSMDDLLTAAARETGQIMAADLSTQRPLPVNIPVTTPGRIVSQICSQRELCWSVSDGVYNMYKVDYR